MTVDLTSRNSDRYANFILTFVTRAASACDIQLRFSRSDSVCATATLRRHYARKVWCHTYTHRTDLRLVIFPRDISQYALISLLDVLAW